MKGTLGLLGLKGEETVLGRWHGLREDSDKLALKHSDGLHL